MEPNIGGLDRGIRLVAGVVLPALVVALDGDVRWYGLVGIIPLASALLRYSPVYVLLGVSTAPLAVSAAPLAAVPHDRRPIVTTQ